MSATTITPLPVPAAANDAAAMQNPAAARRALARVEARRLVRHPLFLLGMTFSTLSTIVAAFEGGGLFALAGGSFGFVGTGLWTFVVVSLATSRERRDGAQDLYAALPLTLGLRTQAQLLSTAGAALAGGALIALAAVAIGGPDLVDTSGGERYSLVRLELLQGPAYLLFVGAMGVLVGTWTRRAYPALIGMAILFMPPVAWLPWWVYGNDVPASVWDAEWLGGASVAWHLLGIVALATLAAAGALARHDRRPRIALLATVSLAAAVAGIALGWPAGM